MKKFPKSTLSSDSAPRVWAPKKSSTLSS